MEISVFDWLATPEGWAALLTLSAMEIVLGIDNVVFISVLVAKLPPAQAERARRLGLAMALVFRVALLFTLTAIMKLTYPVLTILGEELSWRDIILIAGGLFLLYKAVHEMHGEVAGDAHDGVMAAAPRAFMAAVAQIAVIDLVFSVDSIVTAIGMADNLMIMVIAVLIAVAVMYLASGVVARFIAENPTTKVLALAFLMLIGVSLVAEGGGFHLPRPYIYSAMAFAALVEFVNVWARRNKQRAVTRSSEIGNDDTSGHPKA